MKISTISGLRTDNNGPLAHQRGGWETRLGTDSSTAPEPCYLPFPDHEGRKMDVWNLGDIKHLHNLSLNTPARLRELHLQHFLLRCSFSRAGSENV